MSAMNLRKERELLLESEQGLNWAHSLKRPQKGQTQREIDIHHESTRGNEERSIFGRKRKERDQNLISIPDESLKSFIHSFDGLDIEVFKSFKRNQDSREGKEIAREPNLVLKQ